MDSNAVRSDGGAPNVWQALAIAGLERPIGTMPRVSQRVGSRSTPGSGLHTAASRSVSAPSVAGEAILADNIEL